MFWIKQFVAGIFSPGNVKSSAVKRSDILCSRPWNFLSNRCKSLFRKKHNFFLTEESLLRTLSLTKRNLFWLPCQKQFNKSPKKVDCKTKKKSWRLLMENDLQNSLVDTQVALITTLLKKIAVIRQTNCSLKNCENEAFFNRAVYSNICLHWYKAIKKNPDRNINETLWAIFTQCPRKIQETRNFLRNVVH